MKVGHLRCSGLILLAGMTLFLAACSAGAVPSETVATPLPPVLAETRVVAEGQVIPVQYATLSFSGSGVIDVVLAAEGQTVQEGAAIARLQGADRLAAAISAGELELLSAEQALKDLEENAKPVRAQAEMRLANARKAFEDAEKHRSWKNYRNGSPESIDRARADLVLAQDQVKKAEEAFNGVADRGEDDVIRAAALSALAAARKARDRAESNLNYLLKIPDEVEVAQADAEVAVATTELEAAQREWERVKDGPNPDDLALAQARIANAKAQVTAARAGLDDLNLDAPFAGVLVSSSLKAGELVSPASANVVLADLSKWQVETTDLTELNVVGIHPGDAVLVKFDALPEVELRGKVQRIKALGENRMGDITYKVVVDLDEQHPDLRWNMTATVTFEK